MRRSGRQALGCAALVTTALAALAALDSLTPLLRQELSAGDTRGLVGASALTLTLLAGVAFLLRLAFSGVRAPQHAADHELARLHSEAHTDKLTRIGNRRAFDHDLAAQIELRNRTGSAFSLMAVDLDGLKEVNDTYGHQAGDARLRATATSLESVVGSHGTVYRTGGDEFMILLPGKRNSQAIELAHRIHATTEAATGGRALSVGVTETRGTEHRHQLVRQADVALYEAKRARLPVVPYQPRLERQAGGTSAENGSSKSHALAVALAHAVDVRDSGTGNHSLLVAELSVGMGRELGLRGTGLERLRVAALLHDVGKLAVPDAILHERQPLDRAQARTIRDHVTIGRDILVAAGFAEEAVWALRHHEAYDGSGYPGGLSGDDIPLEARIIAVADAFEAMTGARPYGTRRGPESALAELSAHAGTQFDPVCVRALAVVVAASAARQAARLQQFSAHEQTHEHEQHDKADREIQNGIPKQIDFVTHRTRTIADAADAR